MSSRRDILNDLDAAEPPSPASPLPSADEAAQEWLGEERRFLGTREGFADPDPALTDAQIGGMTDEEWRLAQDRRERELAEGTLRRGEDSPQPPVEPPPDEGPVSAEGMDWLEGGGMRPIGPVGDRPGQLNAGPDASPYTPLHRAEIREKFLASLVNPTRDATGVGGTAGALAGAATADEDATPEERWQRAMAGAAGGAALLGGGRYGGSRALLKLAEEGRMGMNLSSMASHPANIDRIRALMLAAADATPDGEVVRVPSMIDYLRSVMEKNPRARMDAELGLLIQDGNTPAEVRRLIAEQSDPRTVWSVGQEWLTDIVSGTNRRRVRGWEQVADRAAARASEIGAYRDSDYGAAGGWDKQDEGVQSMLDELAKFMGLDGQPVTLQVRPRDRFAGAAATRTVDGGRIVQVDSGLLRMIRSGDISEAEVLGVLAHEMGHFLPEGGVGKNLNWLEKIAGRLGTTADALAAGASEETPDAARRAARAAFRDQMLRDSGLTPSRPPRDFGEGVPSIKQMGTDVTGEEFTDIAENATKEWRYWDDLAKQNPEDAAAQQRAAHALELRNWKIEHARTLLTDPNEQTIQKAISAIDRRFDNANPKTRVPEPEARTPDAPSSRVDTPAEGTTPAPAPETTPPPTDKTPDAGLGPKPAAERQPRVYTVEELEQREVERQRRIEAREAERVAREEQRAAQRKVDQAARDMEKAVTGEERRMARETLQEAKRMEREAAQRVAAARQTWEANPGTKPTTGQMPLDMAGNEGRGAQMGLPEESGVPPLTPEQEEIAQKLREAAGKRAGKKRTEDEEAIIEAAIQEMARDQRWAAIAEGNANARGSGPRTGMPGTRDKPLLPGMEEDDLTMPARPVEGEGVEQRGLDSPTPLGPMTPAQQAAADQIAANPAKALPKQIDMGDRLKVGDWVSALRYSGLLSNVSGILSDVATGPVEGVWKLARDLVMETAGKATGRGGRPSATIMEAAAMMDSGLTEGWKLFLDTIKKPLAEGRPDKRIMEEAYKKGNRRAQRIADDVSERIARGETPDAAREAALKANPDNIIAGLMNKRTPTGESEVGRGLVRRLKAQHDAVVEAGGRVGARGKAAEVAATGIEGASRVRAGADEWNAHVAKRMENARQATHQVIEEGLNPFSKAGRARLKDLEANPTGDMLRRSQEEADYLTFRDDPGDFGNRLANLSHNPIGNFLVPMVKTGYNITRRGIERTPVLGAVSLGAEMIANKAAGKGFTAVRRGERVADQAIGTAAWMGLNQLALAGIITGSGPKDQRTRDVMYAQGWRPNSVKIGDAYHSYARLGPVAYPLALAGATGEAQLFGDDDQDASEYLGEVARNAGYWGANQLFLRSFGDLFESLRNFDTDMPRWAVNAAASYGGPLVGGGLMTGIASAADPYERIHDTWQDELRFRVPVVRNQLPARTDVFGENVRNPGAGIPGFVLPTRPGPTRRELDDKKADVRQYVGSQSAEEDLDIKQAIKADDDYYNGTGPKPTPEQRRLANRFAGRENLDYEDFIAAGRAADVERRLAG